MKGVKNMDKDRVKSSIESVVNGLAYSFKLRDQKESRAFFEGKEDLCNKIFKDLNDANIDIFLLKPYSYEEMKHACNLIEPLEDKERILFKSIVLNFSMFERTLNQVISNIEGFPCTTDKSSFLMRSIFRHMLGHKDYENPKKEYWHPKKVFEDWEKLEEALRAILSAINGNYNHYIEVFRKYNIAG